MWTLMEIIFDQTTLKPASTKHLCCGWGHISMQATCVHNQRWSLPLSPATVNRNIMARQQQHLRAGRWRLKVRWSMIDYQECHLIWNETIVEVYYRALARRRIMKLFHHTSWMCWIWAAANIVTVHCHCFPLLPSCDVLGPHKHSLLLALSMLTVCLLDWSIFSCE